MAFAERRGSRWIRILRKKKRLTSLDAARGLALISMFVYHAVWDMIFIFGAELSFYHGFPGLVWQRSICFTFILLAGFCCGLGKRPLRRGLIVFASGLLVTLATLLFMPESRVVFGVLTFIGSGMILTAVCAPALKRTPPPAGAAVSLILFMIFYRVGEGKLLLFAADISLPESLYHGLLATYIGFTDSDFYSTDYFPLLPWLFLFFAGYFLFYIVSRGGFKERLWYIRCRPLEFLGRNSLVAYLAHQPLIYGALWVWFELLCAD